MQRVRLRARRRALWVRSLGSEEFGLEASLAAIAHSEVDRILAGYDELQAAESAFYEDDPVARQLSQEIRHADQRSSEDEPWLRLSRLFSLSQPELDLLALTAAAEMDPRLRRVYGYLNDDATACYPTPWLAACLFQWRTVTRFTHDSSIVRWLLARPEEGLSNPWAIFVPWVADTQTVAWITEGHVFDPSLAGALTESNPGRPRATVCLYPAELAAMTEFVEAFRGQNGHASERPPVEVELIGPWGSGKRTLATRLCAALGKPMIIADSSLLLAPDAPLLSKRENAIRATRTARLAGAVLYWHDADSIDPRVWKVWPRQCSADLTLFGAVSPLASRPVSGVVRRAFKVPSLGRDDRIALWKQVSNSPVPTAVADRTLTPAEVSAAARAIPAGPEAVAQACRQATHQLSHELFTPLGCPYTWDDIVLPPGVRRHLLELMEQARLRWQVYEEWGFGRLCPLSKGITAMFAGASGTGKTMAAQVLGASLGMDLCRIDLAGVVNKYIGETEKRLKQVFDACERGNVLLFFDEADALFGQRTQVKDAHDRYANIQIDYLLQRMEQFDGIAILATNRKSDIDPAFLRRLRFVIDFLPPGPSERLALWRLALPPIAPGGEALLDPIDWEWLASKLTMTGADIKSAALGAAFLARSSGTRIGMQQILSAARREMTKHGVVLRPGEWQE